MDSPSRAGPLVVDVIRVGVVAGLLIVEIMIMAAAGVGVAVVGGMTVVNESMAAPKGGIAAVEEGMLARVHRPLNVEITTTEEDPLTAVGWTTEAEDHPVAKATKTSGRGHPVTVVLTTNKILVAL